ncbi:MAG TPA: RecX family transcriptional regulator, partial [Gaiellaceae bacterium]|nr:RecX family transcriptional regulator [Gaiellaceae bacterium]
RAGVDAAARGEALETLQRVGYVDDARFAERRAQLLAERGWGDAAIAADLEQNGIEAERAAAALALLEPESERARRIAERRGPGPKTAAYLLRRGFDEDVVGPVVAGEP